MQWMVNQLYFYAHYRLGHALVSTPAKVMAKTSTASEILINFPARKLERHNFHSRNAKFMSHDFFWKNFHFRPWKINWVHLNIVIMNFAQYLCFIARRTREWFSWLLPDLNSSPNGNAIAAEGQSRKKITIINMSFNCQSGKSRHHAIGHWLSFETLHNVFLLQFFFHRQHRCPRKKWKHKI